MANIFPRTANFLPFKVAICLGVIGLGVTMAVPYFFTPKYTRVGYEPTQPVPFDHSLHAGQLGMDCRYCHSFVEVSGHSNVPTNQTCLNCHGQGMGGGNIRSDSPKLAAVRDSAESGEPVEWVRVHAAPDYVYFNHAVHVNRGVSCASCHGKVNEMEIVRHDEPHSMGWCLDCHRDPAQHVRPLDDVFNMDWAPESVEREGFYKDLLASGAKPGAVLMGVLGKKNPVEIPEGEKALPYILSQAEKRHGEEMGQEEIGRQLVSHWDLSPPETCASCHR